VEALEEVLGPLDWSWQGEGYELLRAVARRVLDDDYGRDNSTPDASPELYAGGKVVDATAPARRRIQRGRSGRVESI
jgi:hypothetical protein